MTKTIAILSMLHEPTGTDSARRRFRGEPVLRWTLRRLAALAPLTPSPGTPGEGGGEGLQGKAKEQIPAVVLCWEDQSAAATEAIAGTGARISLRGPRRPVQQIEMITAARRWADGWRGGLLGTCEFDRGFHGESAAAVCQEHAADAIVLIDPCAGLVDPALIDGLIRQAEARPDVDLIFSQAAPGLCGVLVRASLLHNLAVGRTHPGALLSYRPDFGRHDPISDPACVPVAVPLARTTRRFTMDSNRQCAMLAAATAHLNGTLPAATGTELLAAVEANDYAAPLPREVVIELTPRRQTRAIFRPGPAQGINRPDMDLAAARRLIDEFSEMDDARLVLAGAGDPLLHDGVMEIIHAAHAAGIRAVALESDFVRVPAERIAALAESTIDVISVHLPAATQATYAAVMGLDAMSDAVAAVRLFAEKRAAHARGVPLLAPTFVKCRQNLAEMEAWYDYWLRTLHCAVITGPSDFGGLIPDVSAADMTGPRRKPCRSLSQRVMVLSDGSVVSCEQDVLGRQKLGTNLKQAWTQIEEMRRNHLAQQWNQHPVCAGCKQWMRS